MKLSKNSVFHGPCGDRGASAYPEGIEDKMKTVNSEQNRKSPSKAQERIGRAFRPDGMPGARQASPLRENAGIIFGGAG